MSTAREGTGLDPAWDEAVRDIAEGGVQRDRAASEAEKATLAALLDLVALRALHASYRIRPAGNGRYTLKGTLDATVDQTCVVSLKPLINKIKHDINAVFWPAEQITGSPGGAIEMEDEPDPEPIENGRLPVARLIFETLADAIDPFPKAPDATVDWTPPPDADKPASPFAALAKLKK